MIDAHNTLPPGESGTGEPMPQAAGGEVVTVAPAVPEASAYGSGAKTDSSALPKGAVVMLIALLLAFTLSGCATYQFGSASMFRPGIRTVHVPVARNETFRHDLGVRLSEALIREIETRTPYKTTGDPNADSTLTCRVVSESKRVLTETDTDDPRALDASVAVRATWIGRGGELLMQNSVVPTGDLAITFSQDARFVPEAGQSIDSATQEAIEDLAQRIVSQMELRW